MPSTSEKENMTAALDKLCDALSKEKEYLNKLAERAMKDGELDTATSIIQNAQRLLEFQQHVAVLVEKWQELDVVHSSSSPSVRRVFGEITFTQRRPDNELVKAHEKDLIKSRLNNSTDSSYCPEFCIEILEELVMMDGIADNQELTKTINKRHRMRYSQFLRARRFMVKIGWTTSDTLNRVTEITELGIRWLNQKLSLDAEKSN
jgi:hypothetical protein